MIFSDVRVREITNILHFTPQILHFDAKNRFDHILGIQLSGKATHIFSDRSFVLEEQCLYFFNQAENYHADVLEKGIAYSIHFTTYEPIRTKSFCLPLSDPAGILRLMDRMDNLYADGSRCSTRMLSAFYSLLATVEEHCEKKYAPKNRKILDARAYIDLHFREKDCIEQAVQLCGISRRRFNDLFRENFCITPNQYLIAVRIEQVKKQLTTSSLSIGQIAELCGFSDIYYFSTTFKRETGISPSAYRDSFWK